MEITFTWGNNLPEVWGDLDNRRKGPGTHILASSRRPVRRFMAYDENGVLDEGSFRNLLPLKYVQSLEQNQQLAHCCRHPENHDIEAWFSSEAEMIKGVPDIYILYCNTCGRRHTRFCVGGGDVRPPVWECSP